MLIYPVETTNGRALEKILAGDASASRMHETNIRVMVGFLRQLSARLPPAARKAEWTARANAIMGDLMLATR